VSNDIEVVPDDLIERLAFEMFVFHGLKTEAEYESCRDLCRKTFFEQLEQVILEHAVKGQDPS